MKIALEVHKMNNLTKQTQQAQKAILDTEIKNSKSTYLLDIKVYIVYLVDG